MYRVKKILVTGATGFIGRNIVEQFQPHYDIYFPDSSELDLLDDYKVKEYLREKSFDLIIHCAIHNGTITSNKDLSLVFKNNLCMFFNIARCNNLYKRMFYFGSGAEYDMRNYIPKMKEGYFDNHVPTDDYGFSKYIMAKYIKNCPNIYDFRLYGVYGKYEDWRIRFISQSICRVINNMDIIINQNVYFDYLYVNDLIRIIEIFINKGTIKDKYLNICTGRTVDLITLAHIVIKISRKKLKIKVRIRDLKDEYSGNNNKLLSTIGRFQFTNFEQSIEELYYWYLNNKKLIDKKYL
jgi:GDP-L-fucose synthase